MIFTTTTTTQQLQDSGSNLFVEQHKGDRRDPAVRQGEHRKHLPCRIYRRMERRKGFADRKHLFDGVKDEISDVPRSTAATEENENGDGPLGEVPVTLGHQDAVAHRGAVLPQATDYDRVEDRLDENRADEEDQQVGNIVEDVNIVAHGTT